MINVRDFGDDRLPPVHGHDMSFKECGLGDRLKPHLCLCPVMSIRDQRGLRAELYQHECRLRIQTVEHVLALAFGPPGVVNEGGSATGWQEQYIELTPATIL